MADKKQPIFVMPSWLLAYRKARAGAAKVAEDVKENVQHAKEHLEKREKEVKLSLEKDRRKIESLKCLSKFLNISFSVFAVATVLVSIALIAVSTMSAVAASAMDAQDDSGRLVGLIVLSVTAATAIAMSIYAQIATCSKKIRPIYVATIVLTILALIQAIIAGAAVRVTPKDAHRIENSLLDSFNLAKQHSPRHVKMWGITQSSFHCCGYHDAYDYRDNPRYPPDIPISCCPTYDSDRPDIVQERDREQCKARHEYYDNGCSGDVLLAISITAQWVFHVSIALIVIELVAVIFGVLIVKTRKDAEKRRNDVQHNDDHHEHGPPPPK